MKHVGLNVAADPFFTLAYTGVEGGARRRLRRRSRPALLAERAGQPVLRARAPGVPMLEPADSQEALDFTKLAFELSEQFDTPVLLRMTTRICALRQRRSSPAASGAEPEPACPAPKHREVRDGPGLRARSATRSMLERLDALTRLGRDRAAQPRRARRGRRRHHLRRASPTSTRARSCPTRAGPQARHDVPLPPSTRSAASPRRSSASSWSRSSSPSSTSRSAPWA